jgi:predicted PurR-regulated permease PerM
MVAVLIGGYFFGFVGLLVAVPFTALGKVLLERVLARESTTGSSTADV